MNEQNCTGCGKPLEPDPVTYLYSVSTWGYASGKPLKAHPQCVPDHAPKWMVRKRDEIRALEAM